MKDTILQRIFIKQLDIGNNLLNKETKRQEYLTDVKGEYVFRPLCVQFLMKDLSTK